MSSLEFAVPQAEEMNIATPGHRLRLAREAMQFAPEDIADRMRLRVDVILDLENDNYRAVNRSVVFIRGYLRGYAKLVALNGDEIIAVFDKLFTEQVPSSTEATSINQSITYDHPRDWQKWLLLGIGSFLLVAATIYGLISHFSSGTQVASAPAPVVVTASPAETALPTTTTTRTEAIKTPIESVKSIAKSPEVVNAAPEAVPHEDATKNKVAHHESDHASAEESE